MRGDLSPALPPLSSGQAARGGRSDPPLPWRSIVSAASLTVPAGTFPPLIARRVASLSVAAPYAVPDKGSQAGVIRLVSGAPAPEALPLNDFARSAAAVFGSTKTGTAALAYGPHAGLPALRSWIGEREGVDASSVPVTNC